jgi:ABC-type uncharacterized transport system YnjBCD ATPase subunit
MLISLIIGAFYAAFALREPLILANIRLNAFAASQRHVGSITANLMV